MQFEIFSPFTSCALSAAPQDEASALSGWQRRKTPQSAGARDRNRFPNLDKRKPRLAKADGLQRQRQRHCCNGNLGCGTTNDSPKKNGSSPPRISSFARKNQISSNGSLLEICPNESSGCMICQAFTLRPCKFQLVYVARSLRRGGASLTKF